MKKAPAPVGIAGPPSVSRSNALLQKSLLLCGILSSVLYAVMNVVVARQWPEYSSVDQTVSELSAVGAPTRTLWVALSIPYTFLTLGFAYGVWMSGAGNRRLRITGTLLIIYGILGVFWPFAPMHLRETLAGGGSTISDTLHIVLGAVTELLFLAALIFAALALGKRFRIYSVITFLVIMIFGTLTFLDAPAISVNAPTPLMGVWERINIGVFLLWTIVLAIVLLRKEDSFINGHWQ